jgi:predicted amidohydrolase
MSKVAAIQMCSSMSVEENLQSASKLIEEAANNGAKLVVLPEMFPIVGMGSEEKIFVMESPGAGPIQDFLSLQASQNNVWIVGGTIPLRTEHKNKIRAACLVYNNKGKPVARYDKIHLFDVELSKKEIYRESDTTEAGERTTVIDTPFGKLGVAVCYDIRFPRLFMDLFNQGAEIIAIPAAFTVKTGEGHWKLLARARAVENFCYIIGACQGGTHASGRTTFGDSLIIDPWGTVLDERQDPTPGLVYGEIDLEKLHKIRASIPVNLHPRRFL